MKFEYEIGERCSIYFWDYFENCIILDRKHENGMNLYLTDIHWQWQNEPFLRKYKTI